MEKHYGEIVECVVRKNGCSITELADGLNLNRRTVYNYFQNKYLKEDIIFKIGLLIRHDFSRELPELFTSEQFDNQRPHPFNDTALYNQEINNGYWKNKYTKLLEVYNETLGLV